ncbi:MAG: thermonuclease family protein [Thermodesulfobacteriota bacterium]
MQRRIHDCSWTTMLLAGLLSGLFVTDSSASRACCARHGGLGDCEASSGMYRCKDGGLSNCPCKPGQPFTVESRVVRVLDCGTLELERDGGQWIAGLYGVVCPERFEDVATQVRDFIRQATAGKKVLVEHTGLDQYGRERVWLHVDGQLVNRTLLRRGLMYWDRRGAPHDTTLKQDELEARQKQRGIWGAPHRGQEKE